MIYYLQIIQASLFILIFPMSIMILRRLLKKTLYKPVILGAAFFVAAITVKGLVLLIDYICFGSQLSMCVRNSRGGGSHETL